MTAETAKPGYHLKYHADEDRLLVSVDIPPAQEYAMALTRRLTKHLLAALAANYVKSATAAAIKNPATREIVLNFEHGSAVGAGVAGGEIRQDAGGKSLVAAPRTVREIRIAPSAQGNTAMLMNDGERTLTIDLTAQRIHIFIAAVLDIAVQAAWDFPTIAAWLDAAPPATAMPRVLH